MKNTTKKHKIFTVYFVISLLALLLVSQNSGADDPVVNHVTISPYKIILNAENKGVSQDIQAIISMPMPSGYSITDQLSVTLQFKTFDNEESKLFSSIALRYCYIDNNFLATFDRKLIQTSLVGSPAIRGIVTATIGGTCTIENSTGSETITFNGSDLVEIIDPGKK